MNKVKQVALAISAISVMGFASISLASGCPTTISPATATCLSNAADATFQTNYTEDYAKQSGSSGSDFSSSNNNQNNSNNAAYSSPRQEQAPSYDKTNTDNNNVNDSSTGNNNNSTTKSIRWF